MFRPFISFRSNGRKHNKWPCYQPWEMICLQHFYNIFTTNSKWQVIITINLIEISKIVINSLYPLLHFLMKKNLSLIPSLLLLLLFSLSLSLSLIYVDLFEITSTTGPITNYSQTILWYWVENCKFFVAE